MNWPQENAKIAKKKRHKCFSLSSLRSFAAKIFLEKAGEISGESRTPHEGRGGRIMAGQNHNGENGVEMQKRCQKNGVRKMKFDGREKGIGAKEGNAEKPEPKKLNHGFHGWRGWEMIRTRSAAWAVPTAPTPTCLPGCEKKRSNESTPREHMA